LRFGREASQSTFLSSGSDSSLGPANVSLVQLAEAPKYPSNMLYSV